MNYEPKAFLSWEFMLYFEKVERRNYRGVFCMGRSRNPLKTSAKRSIARITGIPTTKSRRKRKALNALTGGACIMLANLTEFVYNCFQKEMLGTIAGPFTASMETA